jgi:hypothetical protein
VTAPSTRSPSGEARRWRRALLPSMLIAPVAVALLGCVAFLLAAPELPGRVIVHWGPDGSQTGSPYVALLCLPLTAVVAAVLWVAVRGPANVRRTALLRCVLGLPLWLACFLTIGLVGSVVLQAHPGVPVPGVPLLVGFAVGLVAGGIAALTAPAPPAQPDAPAPLRLPAVRAGERLVWLGRAGAAPGLMATVLGALGAVVVVVVVSGLATDPWLAVVSVVPVLALPLAASMLHWRVRVDGAGVTAVGALGFPRLRVPLHDVVSADVVVVAPIGDYGGLGLRHSRGVTAVATRGGEALQVTRADGRRLVLTVDDAAAAAGVLRALRP